MPRRDFDLRWTGGGTGNVSGVSQSDVTGTIIIVTAHLCASLDRTRGDVLTEWGPSTTVGHLES